MEDEGAGQGGVEKGRAEEQRKVRERELGGAVDDCRLMNRE